MECRDCLLAAVLAGSAGAVYFGVHGLTSRLAGWELPRLLNLLAVAGCVFLAALGQTSAPLSGRRKRASHRVRLMGHPG